MGTSNGFIYAMAGLNAAASRGVMLGTLKRTACPVLPVVDTGDNIN